MIPSRHQMTLDGIWVFCIIFILLSPDDGNRGYSINDGMSLRLSISLNHADGTNKKKDRAARFQL